MAFKAIGYNDADGNVQTASYTIPQGIGSNGQVLSSNGTNLTFTTIYSSSFLTFGLNTQLTNATSPTLLEGAGSTNVFVMPINCLVNTASASLDVVSYSAGMSVRFYIKKNGVQEAIVQINPSGTGGDGNINTFTPISFSAGDIIETEVVHASSGYTTEAHNMMIRILVTI
jgi:hypothetical protein